MTPQQVNHFLVKGQRSKLIAGSWISLKVSLELIHIRLVPVKNGRQIGTKITNYEKIIL